VADRSPGSRALVWLAWAYIAAQFLPWFTAAGTGAHGFFVPAYGGSGWLSYFTELAVVLPFAIAALVRLDDVFPRGRQAVPELALALAFVTAARIVFQFLPSAPDSYVAPGVGAFIGSGLALALVVVAFGARAERAA
jgi:hypothetical protein